MFERRIRSIRHIPVSSVADISFMLLIFFLTSVQFQTSTPPPMLLTDRYIESDPYASVHILQCVSDHTMLIIQDGDTVLCTYSALTDSAQRWASRKQRAIVVLRSKPDTPAREPLNVITLLREAGITGVVLGEFE